MSSKQTIRVAREALRLGSPVYCTSPKGETFRVFRIECIGGNVKAVSLTDSKRRCIEPNSRLHDGARIYGFMD
jgi:hypothetical protein